MKRFSLYPNPDRDRDLSRTAKVISTLPEARFFLEKKYEGMSALSPFCHRITFCTQEELFTEGEALIALGGDGTILSVASRAARADIPVLGINFGRVGFLAALEENQLSQLPRLLTGDYTLSSRMLLACKVDGEEILALNELVIGPEKGLRMMELSLFADGKKLCDYRADGLIFNTPTGSTGYAFSAGGAVIGDTLDCIGVKAVSSYLLINAHHMIFAPETRFSTYGVKSEGDVTVRADGREERILRADSGIEIYRSDKRVKLITLKEQSNLEVFFQKF